MSFFDWIIVIVPVMLVLGMGLHVRRYATSVADFLTASRICGRYVICVGDIAQALSIIGLASYVEVHYRTGYAMAFWNNLTLPLGIFLSLSGYCLYRFRETRAMSLGQFLEMRYGSKGLRIFAAALRSISEMLANMIMPTIAARFFIYLLDFPEKISLFGLQIPTFMVIVTICLCMSIFLISMGGILSIIVTDAMQGMFLYPLMVVFTIFVLCKFSWSNEIAPVLMDRAAGESFINPFDISKLRDFNLFALIVTLFVTVMHRASWLGAGETNAAKTPHEQKMASLLGTWRNAMNSIFYLLIAVMIITVLNHKNFAPLAKEIRTDLCRKVATDVAGSPEMERRIVQNIEKIPPQIHEIGKDAPLSDEHNLDTTYLDNVHNTLLLGNAASQEELDAALAKDTANMNDEEKAIYLRREKRDREANAHSRFQQFRTLYNQLMIASTMRKLLPAGMLGLFCLLLFLAMVSTDDSRIFSAAITISQDCVLPFFKRQLTPRQHCWMVRWVSVGVCVFFFIGSSFMAQLDYISLFVTIVCSLWLGGCGPVMIFGLYSKFGTKAGAWASLLTGMFFSTGSIFLQRKWATWIYPMLNEHNMTETVGRWLETLSRPFNPYIVWKMNPVKCPINSKEF